MLNFFSRKEYQEISDAFQLGSVKRIVYFGKGLQTPKVMVRTPKGEFIISKHRHFSSRDIWSKSRRSFLYEVGLLNVLKKLPVPHYRKSAKGGYVLDFKRFDVTVYRFLPGKQPRFLTPAMVRQLGSFVGSFHAAGRNFRETLKGRRRFYQLTHTVVRRMHVYAQKQKNPRLKRIVTEVKKGVEQNRLPASLPKGPIHVDIKPENELFVREKLTGVIDFGNFYIGPYMLDVGKTVMWNCVRKGRLEKNLLQSFLKGYESKRKLSVQERKYLKRSILFAIFSHIWVDLYHVPIKYVPESYTLFLVRAFLPVARWLTKREPEI
ncbi:MAG: phosphotransferase [Candidatus Brennerbacteria bacterium]